MIDIDKLVRGIKKNKGVKAIYLFGSYAKGTARPFSDMDICVVTGKNQAKVDRETILSNASKFIDLSLFWDLPPVMRYRVMKEGKLLYKSRKDELFMHRAVVDTVAEYLDLAPLINRHYNRLLVK